MSTSPSRAPVPSPAEAPSAEIRLHSSPQPAPLPFPYASLPAGSAGASALDGLSAAASAEAEGRAAARAQGRQEGQAELRQSFEERLTRERSTLASALAQFTRDRAAYFQKVEGEVVQLALSIARKILHREAQLDPLLLAGIARVALEKIDAATGVVLRIHPRDAADWRRYLTTQLEAADLPEIVEDLAQSPESCTLETSMGTAAIGLEVQFKEIEQGLMDLLGARPGAAS